MGYLEDMMYVSQQTYMHNSLSCAAQAFSRDDGLESTFLQPFINQSQRKQHLDVLFSTAFRTQVFVQIHL